MHGPWILKNIYIFNLYTSLPKKKSPHRPTLILAASQKNKNACDLCSTKMSTVSVMWTKAEDVRFLFQEVEETVWRRQCGLTRIAGALRGQKDGSLLGTGCLFQIALVLIGVSVRTAHGDVALRALRQTRYKTGFSDTTRHLVLLKSWMQYWVESSHFWRDFSH